MEMEGLEGWRTARGTLKRKFERAGGVGAQENEKGSKQG